MGEQELSAQCGSDCIEVWNKVVASPSVQAATRSNEQYMSAILTALADQSMAKAKSVSVSVAKNEHQAHTTHLRSTAAVANAVSLDTASSVQVEDAQCERVQLQA